jgi:hypothetical protein
MRKSLLIPDALICLLWKAVCVETRLYSLGRGQRKRAFFGTSPVPYFIREGAVGNVPFGNALAAYFIENLAWRSLMGYADGKQSPDEE